MKKKLLRYPGHREFNSAKARSIFSSLMNVREVVKSTLIINLVSLLFFSCVQKKEVIVHYYNIDSLVKAQIKYLPGKNVVLTKEVALNTKIDSLVMSPHDTLSWSNELDAFSQLSAINKPINIGAYAIENMPDSKSNLTIISFSAKKKQLVEYLKVYFQGSPSNLRKIEALYHEENPLFESSRKMKMEFENIYNTITLINYSIEGDQKMFLGDSIKFSIRGHLKIN